MNQVPHHLKCHASILKNPNIPLFPHNPHQSERSNHPKSTKTLITYYDSNSNYNI